MADVSDKKKIAFIGGGGGVSNMAPALRDLYDVTAIVTTFDNGGSYGRLRYPYRSPLTGDVRRALAALSTNQLGTLSEHRFDRGDIEGHAFGNLLLTAMHATHEHPSQAMEQLHAMYAVAGRVLPVSYSFSDLHAELMDRTILRGEQMIDEPHAKSHVRIRRVWLDPDAVIAPGVAEAIAEADVILMGPGDVYTSLIPNLLVDGVAKAIMTSPAKKVYICNMFTKYGQTNNFPASDHVRVLEQYLQPNTFHTVVLNTSPIDEYVLLQARKRREEPVRQDIDELKKAGYTVLAMELLDGEVQEQHRADAVRRALIRYSPDRVRDLVAQVITSE